MEWSKRLINAEFLKKRYDQEVKKSGEEITSTPPLLKYIEAFLWRADEVQLQQVVKLSHRYDKDYMAWETNRNCITPVGCVRTGYEGYLVPQEGKVVSPEEVRERLLDIGLSIWKDIRLTHRHSFSHRNALEKVIRGEADTSAAITFAAIEEWHTIFGASLGCMRAQILMNRAAQEYRSKVRERVQTLPQIRYVVDATGIIQQEYFIGDEKATDTLSLGISLRGEEELAQHTMLNIGKFGHPLWRAAIQHAHSIRRGRLY